MAPEMAERTCPDCAHPMQVYLLSRPDAGQTEVDHCLRCGSMFLDAGELQALARRMVSASPLVGRTTRRCPACRLTMDPVVLTSGIPAERCSACAGLYFDEGELEELCDVGLTRVPADPDGWKSLLPPGSAETTAGFSCARCGHRFPLSEGNLLASGLACRACTPQPQTTDAEREGAHRDRYPFLENFLFRLFVLLARL